MYADCPALPIVESHLRRCVAVLSRGGQQRRSASTQRGGYNDGTKAVELFEQRTDIFGASFERDPSDPRVPRVLLDKRSYLQRVPRLSSLSSFKISGHASD